MTLSNIYLYIIYDLLNDLILFSLLLQHVEFLWQSKQHNGVLSVGTMLDLVPFPGKPISELVRQGMYT